MAEENFDGSDVGGLPENSNPPEVQEPENELGVNEEKKWPGWPGDNVFRMLVPSQKVGGIIGRKGEFIKKMCEETKARIKILDGPPDSAERTVMVSAKEEPDLALPPAMDALLRVHKRIVDVDSDPAQAPTGAGTVCTRLLVAGSQGGSLIGKHGATIKSIQDGSGCTIRVLSGENVPSFALPEDSIVEVQGEAAGVHKAVEMIAGHLRKFVVDHGIIAVIEFQMQLPLAPENPPQQNWGAPHQGFPPNSGGGGPGFMPNPQYMPPPHAFDNYYPPMDMPPLDKHPRQGPPSYGRDAAIGGHTTGAPPQQSVVTKVTQTMQIPLSYADAVIGASGANISYVRRASGASIAIQETRGAPGEMTVEINGSAAQVQTAQQMIQNSIAEAASAAQNAAGPPPPGQSYYHSQGPAYGTQANPDGQMGHAPPPPADYGAEYGAVYGTGYGNSYGY